MMPATTRPASRTATATTRTGRSSRASSSDRYLQETNTLLLKASVVSQVNREHQLKTGLEVSLPEVKFGSPGYLTFSSPDGGRRPSCDTSTIRRIIRRSPPTTR